MTPEIAPAASSSQRATTREFFAVVFRRRWIVIGLFAACWSDGASSRA